MEENMDFSKKIEKVLEDYGFTFPEKIEGFLEDYGFIDVDQVYTDEEILMPLFQTYQTVNTLDKE